MKKTLLLFCLIVSTVYSFSQTSYDLNYDEENNTTINAGLLMGGGGIVGVDIEHKVNRIIGFQAGLGLSSFGAGMTFHFRNTINSSFASIQYWRQGLGNSYFGSYLGPMFVFRAKKYFQAGIGLGYIVDKGSILDTKYRDQNIMAVYNIGVYFPL